MPRHVNYDQRRRDILDATLRILAERGVGGLSFRSIAKELGGSTTLVTHYFGSQADLIEGLAQSLASEWPAELEELEKATEDPVARLMTLLEWLVPSTESGVMEERARIALLADRLASDDVTANFAVWEERIRALLRSHLKGIVPSKDVDQRVDMLRVVTNGLTLSAIENPEIWNRDRLRSVLVRALLDMGLDVPKGRPPILA